MSNKQLILTDKEIKLIEALRERAVYFGKTDCTFYWKNKEIVRAEFPKALESAVFD